MKTLILSLLVLGVALICVPTADANGGVLVVRRTPLRPFVGLVPVRRAVIAQPIVVRRAFATPVILQPQAFYVPTVQPIYAQQFAAPVQYQSFSYSSAFTSPSAYVQQFSAPVIQSNGCAAFFSY